FAKTGNDLMNMCVTRLSFTRCLKSEVRDPVRVRARRHFHLAGITPTRARGHGDFGPISNAGAEYAPTYPYKTFIPVNYSDQIYQSSRRAQPQRPRTCMTTQCMTHRTMNYATAW